MMPMPSSSPSTATALVTASRTMSGTDNQTVLQMVLWATKLCHGLYDFSATVTSATGDVTSLAKEINLLSLVLRQAGSNLREDLTFPSEEAFITVREVLGQCRDVFGEVEQLVPVRELQDASVVDGALVGRLRGEMEWNGLSQGWMRYLLAHVESLKLTLSVLLQTIYTAKIEAWGRQQKTAIASEAVMTERLQMESLIIEQQLSLLRAHKLHEHFKQQVGKTPLLPSQTPQSQALILRDTQGPNPKSLMHYQEPSLMFITPSVNETEDLARIRRVSFPFVDILLTKWTRWDDIEKRMRNKTCAIDDSRAETRRQPEMRERRNSNWQRPSIESDDDSDVERTHQRPNLRLSAPGAPVLELANGDEASDIVSPIPIPGAGIQQPAVLRRGPFSPSPSTSSSRSAFSPPPSVASSQSWTPGSASSAYFAQRGGFSAERYKARPSPAVSPLSVSPHTNFSGDTIRPVTAFKASSDATQQGGPVISPTLPKVQQIQSVLPLQKAPIPWRLRLRNNYWDFLSTSLVATNSDFPPPLPQSSSSSHSDSRNFVTEIMAEFVSRDALDERGHEYTRVKKDVSTDKKRTRLENCYCISGVLDFKELERLVDRTTEIRYPPVRRRKSSVLERVHTAPSTSSLRRRSSVYHDRDRERERERPGERHRSNSLDSEDERHYDKRRDSKRDDGDMSRRRRDSESKSRRDSVSRRDSSRNDSRRRDSTNKKIPTFTKMAMGGAGLLALLDGLPDALAAL